MALVSLRPVSPKGAAVVLDLLGTDTRSGGVGGWGELSRPRRVNALEWNGTPLYTLQFDGLINGAEARPGVDASVERTILLLRQLGRKAAATGKPPILQVSGPVDVTAAERWVLTDLVLGQTIRNREGLRVQQYVTVTLTQYVQATPLGPARRWRDKNGNAPAGSATSGPFIAQPLSQTSGGGGG